MLSRQPGRPDNAPRYAAPEPYPSIQVCGPNKKYAQMLKIDLACPQSELTAVTQYVYQSWQLDPKLSQVSNTMRHVAMVEMHHLDMLGQLIVLLGGNPTFSCRQQGRQIIWDGGMVTYCHDSLAQMMKENIAAEEFAIETYQRQIKCIDDPNIVAILQRIILDEKVHLEIFHQYLAEAQC
ncbi:ferritin-like domain-containing protein [Solibaculum mannosilyticum]|uniref:Bacterioferritin n=1 Tax=Solibaculum mannosilyticum TaxID=2780922 RepID=A0A7I8D2R9_9FIRM|nr:ferritin-like domain-containing protein [Solibaculum mannosilyticum]BCI60285.1 bacterioferritin [Solibaculum mannosilyticum]